MWVSVDIKRTHTIKIPSRQSWSKYDRFATIVIDDRDLPGPEYPASSRNGGIAQDIFHFVLFQKHLSRWGFSDILFSMNIVYFYPFCFPELD